MIRSRLLLLAALLAPCLAHAEREWRFRVLLDATEVGTHTFRVTERGGERLVTSDARFKVKLLFINAYSYAHEARERWQGDCLSELDARTDDNGERVTVRTRPPACVMSFAYWNPRMLQQKQLLNAQTGELTEVRVEKLGEETLRVRGSQKSASRFALHAPKFRIDVWYADGTDWVQLESRTESGRLLRYEIQ